MQSCRATEIKGTIRYLFPFEVTNTLKIQGLVESQVGVHIIAIFASCVSLFFHSWMPILTDSFCLCGIYSSGIPEEPHFWCCYGIIKFGKLCVLQYLQFPSTRHHLVSHNGRRILCRITWQMNINRSLSPTDEHQRGGPFWPRLWDPFMLQPPVPHFLEILIIHAYVADACVSGDQCPGRFLGRTSRDPIVS